MGKEYHYEIEQGGIVVAAVSSENQDEAQRQIMHYAAVYSQDGPVRISGEGVEKIFESFKHTKCAAPHTDSIRR